MVDVVRRVKYVFSNTSYKERVDKSDKRWIDTDIEEIFKGIIHFLERNSF